MVDLRDPLRGVVTFGPRPIGTVSGRGPLVDRDVLGISSSTSLRGATLRL